MTKFFNFVSKIVKSVKYSVQKAKYKKKEEPVVGLSLRTLHFDSNVLSTKPKPTLSVIVWNKLYPAVDRCSLLSSELGTSDYDYSDESYEQRRTIENCTFNLDESLFSHHSTLLEDESDMEFREVEWMCNSGSTLTLSSFIEIIEMMHEPLQVYMSFEDEVLCEDCCPPDEIKDDDSSIR